MRYSLYLVALAGFGVLGSGCRFSASASGNVKSSGDVSGDADAKLTEKAPAAETPPKAQASSITLRGKRLDYKGVINFAYDKAELRSDAETQETLAQFKSFLEQHPEVKIEVEGHTDSRGSDDYNRDLSERRAASVRQWLIAAGIKEDRVSSVGKGEDAPQVEEPEACNDKDPKDTTPCEVPWATNRRVVFEVTGGVETVPQPVEVASAPEPEEPEPLPPPVEEAPKCPWLWGGHANALGPNSWVTLAGATQPGICWLELSLGVGLGLGDVSAEEPAGGSADGSYVSFTVPLRGRIWFMDRHSLLGDVGIGFTHYRISAEADSVGGLTADYVRNTTPLIGHLGVGYGFRPNGSNAGPRLALLVGGLFHLTDLGASELDAPPGFMNPVAIQGALDQETDELADAELYGEASFGWLF